MRKTFSITDKQVLDKLEEVDNQSKYITELILKDIYDGYGGIEFKKCIFDTLESIIMQVEMIKKACVDRDKNFFNKT